MAKCAQCGRVAAWRSGVCKRCHLRRYSDQQRKYVFTEELLHDLREAYVGDKGHLVEAIDRLVMKTGWPRYIFLNKAVALRITRPTAWRAWKAHEEEFLTEHAGVIPAKEIAKRLSRGYASVRQKAHAMRLPLRPQEGYTIHDLRALGPAMGKTECAFNMALLKKHLFGQAQEFHGKRVSEEDVVRFLVQHPEAYDLRRLDQRWFKAVLFGAAQHGACDFKRLIGEGR